MENNEVGVFSIEGKTHENGQFGIRPNIDGPTSFGHVDVCFMLIENKLEEENDISPFTNSAHKYFNFIITPTDGIEGFVISKFEHSGFTFERLTEILEIGKKQILSTLR